MIKKLIFGFCILLVLFAFFLYQAYTLKKHLVETLKEDRVKIEVYTKWGYDVGEFKNMYERLINETDKMPFFLIPFKTQLLKNKHDNILRLALAGYATEVSRQKNEVQSRLTYLRDRVKTNDYISQTNKQAYFDTFEITAGNIFEKYSTINDLKDALTNLKEQDVKITKEVEAVRKESLLNELQTYKTTCVELLSYFTEKNNSTNQELANECISSADKLMEPQYKKNGADFIETLSRERVFTSMQKALQAKQQMIQDEQYALLMKKKEEERLTVVPPAPRQEGKIIVVNIGLQRLYAYENGSTLFPTAVPITTGKQGFETVLGEFAIYLKERYHQMKSPFPGIYYDDIVSYWMPFYLGYGLHDAPWRSVYGTQDYTSVGSHGCVNIPLRETSILYNWAEVGTRVIVL